MSSLRRAWYTKPIPANAKIVTHKGKPHARFTGADGKIVLAPLNENGDRIRLRSEKWYGQYIDAQGTSQRVPLATDKVAAQQMLNDLVRKAERGRAGISDPYEEQHLQPLKVHLADFERFLKSKGDGAKHARDCVVRVRKILAGCGFTFISDIAPGRVQDFLSEMLHQAEARPPLDPTQEWYTKKELAQVLGVKPHCLTPLIRRWSLPAKGKGKARRYPRETAEALLDRLDPSKGPATVNHYLRSLKTFTRWLVKDNRTGTDPIAYLSGYHTSTDVRHARRTLSHQELELILEGARTSKRSFRGLTGQDRHMLYLTACSTGFRASELAQLVPASFALDDTTPAVTSRAAYTKNRKLAVQPLPSDLVPALREYLGDCPKGQPVWPGTWSDGDAAEMLRIDLEAAGIPYVVDGPDGPLYADFHALRHSYIAMLDRTGATLKEAMQLARHSDPKLTMAVYGRARLQDLGGTVNRLPSLGTPKEVRSERAG